MLRALAVALTLLSCTCEENPAIQVILTNKGLQYGKHAGAGWIQDRLGSITFPDIGGRFGSIYYTLTGTTITKCDFPEPIMEFVREPAGFKTSVLGLSVALAGEWRTQFGIIHDGGTFEMAVFSLSVTSVAKLGKDNNGHLSITSVSCDAKVGDVSMWFHGGASWIFQPFLNLFKSEIIEKIRSQLCTVVHQAIDILEDRLQTTNVSFAVDPVLTLDLPLTDLPVTDASNLKLDFKGEFYSETHKEPPFVAQPFTMAEQPKYMLSLGVSEFSLNSASYAYFSAGLLQALVNDSMVFQKLHVHLNTTSVGKFIPQLTKMFPDLPMGLQVYARDAPLFSFQPDAFKLPVRAAVKAVAIEPNGTQVPLFQLNVDIMFSGKMWISNGKVKGSVVLDNFTLTLASSEVGTFSTLSLENAMRTVIKTMVLFKVNEILGQGTLLPRMKYAQLVNSVLKMEKGFIAISSDVQIFQTD